MKLKEAHPLETAVGMELYSTDFPGFDGKLKTRYEDFLVEEIAPDQEILQFQEWTHKPFGEPDLQGKRLQIPAGGRISQPGGRVKDRS